MSFLQNIAGSVAPLPTQISLESTPFLVGLCACLAKALALIVPKLISTVLLCLVNAFAFGVPKLLKMMEPVHCIDDSACLNSDRFQSSPKEMPNAVCDGLPCIVLTEENVECTCQTGRSSPPPLDFTALECPTPRATGCPEEKVDMTCRTGRSRPPSLDFTVLTLPEKLEFAELSCTPEPEEDANFVNKSEYTDELQQFFYRLALDLMRMMYP